MLGWITETTLVAAVIALMALMVGRLFSIGPTVRHALWVVVLIKLITPPLVSWPWATRWQVLEWPAQWNQTAAATSGRTIDGPRSSRWHAKPESASAIVSKADPVGNVTNETSRRAQAVRPATTLIGKPDRVWAWAGMLPEPATLVRSMVWGWMTVSALLVVVQTVRIVRFRRRLWAAIPAPDDLLDEANMISQRLGVAMPELLVVPDLGTPMLWCLGRPKLLLPARLVKTLPRARWRGILAHELADLRRGDHWVSRLELAAGLVWWWNPLYWLACTRLNAEAELACDAWVVWALPEDRLAYAEVLFDICATLSLARPPAPTLGVAGSGQFIERRLTMILRDNVPCRFTPGSFLGAIALLFFAVPSWSAVLTPLEPGKRAVLLSAPDVEPSSRAGDDDKKPLENDRDKDAEEEDADDAPVDSDDDKPSSGDKPKAKIKKPERDVDVDVSAIEKEIDSKFGPGSDFEKKIEAFAKEIEARLGSGSEFEKKIEAFSKEIESKFGSGSEFEKKMEAFGKEMESKFGPGSDFEKRMEAFGKEIETKLGPGSDFEKAISSLAEEMKEKFGPGSEFVQKLKEKSEADVDKKPAPAGTKAAKAGADAKTRQRERRIHELEAQIEKLVEEINELKSDDHRAPDDEE